LHRKGKLQITFNVEGRSVRRYVIDAKQIIQDSACRASEYIQDLLDERTKFDGCAAEIEDQIVDYAPAVCKDQDSVLGTQSVIEDHIAQQLEPETWESFRARRIPSSVNEIIFIVSGEEISGDVSAALHSRFPGVTFTSVSSASPNSGPQALDRNKQPLGIKTMMLELDEEQLAQSPMLEEEIRERYPWATIQAKAGSNTSRKRIPRPADQIATSGQDLDPIQHLSDLAEYAKAPPPTQDFEVYDPETFEDWDKLATARKLEVAHARAIQVQYGKTIDGGGCGHCVKVGYRCKGYASELHKMGTPMNLGLACQNCRLKNLTCDLVSAATSDETGLTATSNKLDLQAGTQEAHVRLSEDLNAPSATSPTPKPSLASRITPHENQIQIRGVATTYPNDEYSHGPAPPTGPKRSAAWVSGTNMSPILLFAESSKCLCTKCM
jgi:hypothetical protein